MTPQTLPFHPGPGLTLEYTCALPNWGACSVLSSGLVQGLGQEAGLEGSNLPTHLHDKGPPEHGEVADFRQAGGSGKGHLAPAVGCHLFIQE